MDHALAISQYLAQYAIPGLLSLLCALASYIVYLQKQYMQKHERTHERLESIASGHESRLIRVETRVDHVENDVEIIRKEIFHP